MYENRCIAFIDILGFGALVEESENNIDLQKTIHEALFSLHTQNLNEEAYSRVNVELVPPEELEAVKEIAKIFNQAMKNAHSVLVTFFSDSLVISAKSDDILASQVVLDLTAKLALRLWHDHNLLIRGGITIGKFLHNENGPLFGPAMNRAYFLESKKAINPRVIVDSDCLKYFQGAESFKPLNSLILHDAEYSYINLASAFKHTINDSSEAIFGEKVISRHRASLATTLLRLKGIEEKQTDPSIKSKYIWLIEEMVNIMPQIENS